MNWATSVAVGGVVSAACFALIARWDTIEEVLAAFLVGSLVSAFVVLLAALAYRRLGRRFLLPVATVAYLLGAAPAVALRISVGLNYHRLDYPGMAPGWLDLWMWMRNGLTDTAAIMLGLGAAAAASTFWLGAGRTRRNVARSSLDIAN